jgi:hypothetical protein
LQEAAKIFVMEADDSNNISHEVCLPELASKRENASATSRISLLSDKVSRESNNLKRFAANNLIKNAANGDKNNEDKKRR